MKLTHWLRLGAGCAALSVALVAQATNYTFTNIDVAGATETEVWDVNNHGQVAGASVGGDGVLHGFVYSNGSYTSITGPSGSLDSIAMSVSDTGTVVGSYSDASSSRGFIYESGVYQDFYVPGSFFTVVRGISSNGRYITGSYGMDGVYQNAFILDRSTNELRLVQTAALLHGVNDSGVAAGGSFLGDNLPFIYDFATNTTTSQAIPFTRFRDVSNDGTVIGFTLGDSTASFIGKPGSFEAISAPAGFENFIAEGTNDGGWLAGIAYSPTDDMPWAHGFIAIPTAVPEPSTYALLTLGLAALGWRSRRR
jgi:probable HAF family extracellular repeat protein